MFLLISAPAAADVVTVSSEQELLSAIDEAASGDEIVLTDGTYSIDSNVWCTSPGTPDAPIVVRSETPLGAKLELDALEGFVVTAPDWHFEGLDIRGVCANDSDCEHAFHVTGRADGFVLQNSRVVDFNAQLKVNANDVDGTYVAPNDGLVEGCDIGDSRARQTSAPVTKLNIDGGVGWIVRGNYLHDFHKDGGNTISYGAFMKSGGQSGLFARNLVVCDAGASSGGARIGLSFGGGGTGAQFCAPAYDPDVPCDPEHTGGEMRNNVIVGCSDVGIYLNRARDTTLLYNTLIATTGIDFRFDSSSGHADGNVVSGPIRDRDGATHTEGTNLLDVAQQRFERWYAEPLAGDLSLVDDPTELLGEGNPSVTDDYCGRARPQQNLTLGALEHSLGDCDTLPPPSNDEEPSSSEGEAGSGGPAITPGGMSGSGPFDGGNGVEDAPGTSEEDADGCGCRVGRRHRQATGMLGWVAFLLLVSRRRRVQHGHE